MEFSEIFKKYYSRIYKYCYAQLRCDKQLAEECCQDVFMALSRKMNILPLSTDVEAWLFNTAKKEVLNYYKKYIKKQKYFISIEDISEKEEAVSAEEPDEALSDILSDDEYKLIRDYYENSNDKTHIAEKYNISKNTLYQRISRIKQKIQKYFNK